MTFRHRAGVSPYTSFSTLQRPVFLLNSRLGQFAAATSGYEPYRGNPFPEVTDLMCLVPERSFNRAPLDILLVYLCRFVVRVPESSLGDFPGSVESSTLGFAPLCVFSALMKKWICLPLPPYNTQSLVSIERLAYPTASLHRS